MNILDQYVIPLKGLKDGSYTYKFDVNNSFFDEFENSEIKKGNLKVEVILNKIISSITLSFKIKGNINVTCDRCLDNINMKVNSSNQLFVKYGDGEEDADIIYIPESNHQINIAQYIYEFINFSLPLKRVHPVDKQGNSLCNIEMIKKINELQHINSEEGDPRWEVLLNIKNKKNI